MRRILCFAALTAAASCTPAPRHVQGTAEAPRLLTARAAIRADTTSYAARLARGRQTVQTVCASCHSEAPPAKTAPPFRMIAMHYRRGTADSLAAAAAIVAWVRAPAVERSLLPPMVIRRFGLMPALPLAEGNLGDAALYILSLHEGAAMRGPGATSGGRMMRGRGTPSEHGSAAPPPGRD